MMDLVNFIGQDFRHFLGSIIFILVCCAGLSWVVEAARGRGDGE